jgi:4-amino-4-deoxy-L-arabinose transferase-like glycosyltransferase
VVPQTSWLALILFGFFLGLAVLAKGPAAIILSGGAIFFWALFTKRWRDAFRLVHPAALAAFCLTALPWYILCARRNPDFFRIFIIEHNFKRYLTPEFQHIQPFWFYLPVLLVAFLPWTGALLWTAAVGGAQIAFRKKPSSPSLFLLSWSLFVVLFFTLSRSKLPGYILPALPAICLVMARGCTARAHAHSKSFRLVVLFSALFFFVLLGLLSSMTPHVLQGNEKFGIAISLVLVAVGAANLFLGIFQTSHQESLHRLLAAASFVLPLLLITSLSDKLLPSFFRSDPSGRSLARELQVRNIPSERLMVAWMDRGLHYSLNYYLHKEIGVWNWDHLTEGYVVTGTYLCKRLDRPPFPCRPIPIDYESTGSFLFWVGPFTSADNLPRSGQPH